MKKSLAMAFAAGSLAASAAAPAPVPEIDHLQISPDISLRRMVVHHPAPKGIVLLLHGFPETMYTWQDVSLALGKDYEVHAFDWPGFGQSSRPPADEFPYAPADYAKVLGHYIEKAGIDKSRLVIYASDIGALPPLLLALEQPGIARTIIVGDFAPFDRPQYMAERLQNLKSAPTAGPTRATMNKGRDEIVENAFRRGLAVEDQFSVSPQFKADMTCGWDYGSMTTADAFYHYYSHFTRDQLWFEANLPRLRTPLKILWGEKDVYINSRMGEELAAKSGSQLTVLPNLGHYPHLQDPARTVQEIEAAFR